jgi:hypothetical protein
MLSGRMEVAQTVAGWVVGVVVVGAIMFGVGSCVRRDMLFSDACRRAGGVVIRNQECAKVERLPLPEYQP